MIALDLRRERQEKGQVWPPRQRDTEPQLVLGLASSPMPLLHRGTRPPGSGARLIVLLQGEKPSLSTSPVAAQDMLSISPFRDSTAANLAGGFASTNTARKRPVSTGARRVQRCTHAPVDRYASAHFLDLVNSNHTLSPFTRNMEHFTVRSAPGDARVADDVWQRQCGREQCCEWYWDDEWKLADWVEEAWSAGWRSRELQTCAESTRSTREPAHQAAASGPSSTLPARRRRNFQLGGSSSRDDAPQPVSSPLETNADQGFASYPIRARKPSEHPDRPPHLPRTLSQKAYDRASRNVRRRSRPDYGSSLEPARMSAFALGGHS